MAIDSERKRKSAATVAAVFLAVSVVPSGTIEQADRQHIAWSYSGIAAAGPIVPTIPGLEWTVEVNRLHYTASVSRLHYTPDDEDK